MMRRLPTASLVLLSALAAMAALTSPALAQSNAFSQGPGLAPVPVAPTAINLETAPTVRPVDERVAFNPPEQWMIPKYFQKVREQQRRAARSKRYDRALPAGLSKDPSKGDHIPLGILAELHRLPGPLLRDLPPARPGTDRVIIGKNVVMVGIADGQVLDILPNIIF